MTDITFYVPSKPCLKNNPAGYAFDVALVSQVDTKTFETSPTLSEWDFVKVLDGVAGLELTNVPTWVTNAGRVVRIVLTQAETNADLITIVCHDDSGAEWCDLLISFPTVVASTTTLADIATAVWAASTRTLSSFGSLVSDVAAAVWAYVTRTLTSGAAPSVADIDTQLTSTHGAGLWTSAAAGSGAVTYPYVVTSSVDSMPIADVHVWVTTDAAGLNRIASGTTDALGSVTFYLDPGSYYFWRYKYGYAIQPGVDDNNPEIETVI